MKFNLNKNKIFTKNTLKPNWIKVKLPNGEKYHKLRILVDKYKLHTICQSGNCPNMGECWTNGVATFMILGNICTRSCRFCNVQTGKPKKLDLHEPTKIAYSIKIMNIKHAVITSVDRDDLKDMGVSIWIQTIQSIRKINPNITLETLIPDFQGKKNLLDNILYENPEVISHNIETVERLTKQVRVQAKYQRSLEVLNYLKINSKNSKIKSGIMLGLGETENEVIQTMQDIKNTGASIITIGQYLQPTKKHISVYSFISPKQFLKYKNIGLKMGFKHVESGPLVRSSYHAEKHII